tara:strand:+ start:109 stop:615 length:507 start_codon:yes stop_codon:yes gene_type:complete
MIDLLSNFDLLNYSKLLNIPLHSVLSKDLFNKVTPKQGGYIINLQDHDKGNGTHWTALVLLNNHAIYYDSYGIVPPSDIRKFVKRYNKKMPILYSTDQIQTLKSVLCGWFCLFFLYYFLVMHKNSKANARYLQNKHNSIFSINNRHLNDKILQALIKNIMIENKIINI